MHVGSIQSLSPFDVKSRNTGELFTHCRSLTDLFAVKGIDINHEEIPSKHRASSAHFHSHRNELHIVLSGKIVVHLDDQQKTLNTGDYAMFNAGEPLFHFLENPFEDAAQILTISSHHEDDIVQYAQPK